MALTPDPPPAIPPSVSGDENEHAEDERRHDSPPEGEERYGPLTLSRTRKRDGRMLILYSDPR